MQDGTGSGKEIVTLPVDTALIERAREQGVDLAELLDRALRRELPPTAASRGSPSIQEWRRENAATFAAWNEEVEREGLWNDDFRPF